MRDLVEWLKRQLDQGENVARDASQGPWSVNHRLGGSVDAPGWSVAGGATRQDLEHIALHDPAHELNVVAAHRAILAEHVPWHFDGNTNPPDRILCLICSGPNRHGEQCGRTYPCSTLRSLALAYSDRPGYQEEWRP